MLSYRHGFHAGNHADVLKHYVLVELLEYLNNKDTAYSYIDTHAGAGLYSLDTGYATKNAEYETGISPLWECEDVPATLQSYLDIIRALNPSGRLRYYPGSPYFAEQILRDQDRLRLFELHPSEIKILGENFHKLAQHKAEQGVRQVSRGKRVMINAGDGFEGLKGLLPPPSRRALVLIDPPYEVKDDYRRVKVCLEDAVQRFPTGTYAVWYPALARQESQQLPERLKRVQGNSWLNVTLSISGPTPDGFGLHSSGMFIINPPWTLEAKLKEVMPFLVRVLGKDKQARFTLETGEPIKSGKVAGERQERTSLNPRASTGVGRSQFDERRPRADQLTNQRTNKHANRAPSEMSQAGNDRTSRGPRSPRAPRGEGTSTNTRSADRPRRK